MNLIEVSEINKKQYDQFVEKTSGSFLQSWEWGEWQSFLGRQVKRFLIVNKNNREDVLGAAQFVKMPLPLGRFYWYCPYGPTWDKNQNSNIKNQNFIQQLAEVLSDAVFVKLEPVSQPIIQSENRLIVKSNNIQPLRTLILDLDKTEDELLSEMHPKTRYNIRLAQKHNVRIEKELAVTPGRGLFHKEFLDLIVKTAQRQDYRGHPHNYYKQLIDFFALKNSGKLYINLYKAIKDKELLACGLMVDFGKTRTYLFGGSSETNKNLMAPYLLHFQAMGEAKKSGFKFYDFWGLETSSGKNAGFVRFKLGFGGREVAYPGAYDFPLKENQYRFYKFLKNIKKIL